ncbi:MAG: hypothetical protein JWM34_1289 [Ilumatobacteraceae bacterium]|nr:hypothetical protein [Ilumatobacteraceae bacterium]
MSRYLSGNQTPPAGVEDAARRYVQSHSNSEVSHQLRTLEQHDLGESVSSTDPVNTDRQQENTESMDDRFDSAVRTVTDEPLLGPRQGALVDAMTARLRNGPPHSKADLAVFNALSRVLGLPST